MFYLDFFSFVDTENFCVIYVFAFFVFSFLNLVNLFAAFLDFESYQLSSSRQKMFKFFTFLMMLALLVGGGQGGPAAYGICQAGCAAIVTACYAAAGFTFGLIILKFYILFR